MSDIPRVVVSTVVAADAATAFALFTAEVDAWWKRGPRYRPSLRGPGVLSFEPEVGGRLLETYADGSTFEFGRVSAWEPPRRLVFSLIARDFGPGESTEVEVRFEDAGQQTRVTVEHRGWDRFGPDHPVRHGMGEPAFSKMMGGWWEELLAALQNRVAQSQPETS